MSSVFMYIKHYPYDVKASFLLLLVFWDWG